MLPTAVLRLDRDAGLFGRLTAADPCLARPLPAGPPIRVREDDGLRYTDADRSGPDRRPFF